MCVKVLSVSLFSCHITLSYQEYREPANKIRRSKMSCYSQLYLYCKHKSGNMDNYPQMAWFVKCGWKHKYYYQ